MEPKKLAKHNQLIWSKRPKTADIRDSEPLHSLKDQTQYRSIRSHWSITELTIGHSERTGFGRRWDLGAAIQDSSELVGRSIQGQPLLDVEDALGAATVGAGGGHF